MHYGFRIVEDWIDGLSNWMDEKGFRTLNDFRGLSVPKVTEWKHLDLNPPKIVARINEENASGASSAMRPVGMARTNAFTQRRWIATATSP